ncbi:complement decay-accelerating factor [Dromiciops gliroides]|uniref:complement decay-accelerating factor n=1 Tax=Dromiciops gliroides TaxID=33562 RepID=UPI001CC3C646|nr:complement decay-accelerating factor [Dromiciops gliroides]
MSPASHSAPQTLGLLGFPCLLLLLLLCVPAARGACSIPPDIPNAKPELNGLTSFPVDTTITYKCNEGFVKIPGKSDSVVCLQPDKWSKLSEFCNRTCNVPPSLRFASLKKQFSKQNYFPVGFVVQYECRLGYKRDPSLPAKLTCLQNLTWSSASEFCKRKSCPTPPELLNGFVSITTDTLLGSIITFTCDKGYRLVGAQDSQCILMDKNVLWSDPHPECTEILCPEPPNISNGEIQGNQDSYKYGSSVTYTCSKDFSLIGEKSIHCTVENEQGEWSGPPPECKDVNCKSPVVPNGHTISPSKPPFKYQDTLIFDCNPGFTLVGNSTIYCGPDSQWIPGIPSCKGTTTLAPTTAEKSITTPALATPAPPTEQAKATPAPPTEQAKATPAPPTEQAKATPALATPAPPTEQAKATPALATPAPPTEQAKATPAPPTEQAKATPAQATPAPPTEQVKATPAPPTEQAKATPAPPTEQAKATPAQATPAPPTEQAKATPAQATPAPPTEQAKATPALATPAPPTEQAKATPAQATPAPPTEQAKATPAQATPAPPTEQAKATPAQATPAPPTEQAKATPAQATPAPPTEQAKATPAQATPAPPTEQASTTNTATTPTTPTTRRSTTTQSSTRIVTTHRSITTTSFHTTRPSSTKFRGKGTTPSGAATNLYGKSGSKGFLRSCCLCKRSFPIWYFRIIILSDHSWNAIESESLRVSKTHQVKGWYGQILRRCRKIKCYSVVGVFQIYFIDTPGRRIYVK